MFGTAITNSAHTQSSRPSFFQKEQGGNTFIQPKLNIGKPGDVYEVEADRVADTIVAKGNEQNTPFFSPSPTIQKQPEEEIQKQGEIESEIQEKPIIESVKPLLQKQSEEEPIQEKEEQEEIQQKPEEEIQKQPENEILSQDIPAEIPVQQKVDSTATTSEIQKQEEEVQEKEEEEEAIQEKSFLQKSEEPDTDIEEEIPVQTKPNDSVTSSGVEKPSIESQLNNTSGGSPMPKDTQSQMESGFGTDFSGVRVHTDSAAVQMNRDLGAQAFTHGNDIYFNEGKYDTSSDSGQHLLAHELTHTVQQGASVQRKSSEVTPAAPQMIQGFGVIDLIPDWIINRARHIPGYTLFTVIIEYDPLLEQRVERTPINLTEGLMGLVPFGTAIFDKLQEYGIIQHVFDWVSGQLSGLSLTSDGLLDLLEEAWDELEFPYTNAISVITDKFNQLINRIERFATSLVDQIISWIKEALIDIAEPILEENQAWSLIKKIIHYDPLRDEEVVAPTVEILEDFLMLIGKETELEQMRERGTLQETADWLDTQVGTFMSLLGELRGLITSAWDAIQPSNLPDIADNLSGLATRATGFLERVWDFAVTVAIEVLKLIKKALLSWLSSVANETRGFSLIKVIIGKDPFTDEHVPRTVPNLIRGFMSLMDGGEAQYAQMVETGAIARITGQIEAAVETLNMTPQSIVQLFIDLWNSFSIDDLLNPIDAFIRIIEKFGEPIGRLIAFVAEIVRIVIVAILEIMNFPFELIGNIITRSLQAIDDIKKDPIGFLKNILRAIKEGFVKFFDNIVTHLINGVMGWLMQELRDAGIPELTDFSLQGVISWVLEVLGLSMEKIWEKLAEHPRIGPERVARIRGAINTLEGIWTFIKDVQERGIAAIWDKIQEQLSNLWNIVLDAVKNFVMTRIITQITTKLLSMLDPTGIMAVINGAIAFFNAIQSFIQYLREMLEVVNSFVNGVADIAKGNVATAADYLERTMGQSMPVVIGFLANQVGLSGIGARIAEIIGSVRALIDEALTWLVNKAVDTGMALLDRVMAMGANARDAILGWLGIRREFTLANGERHEIYFQGSEEVPRVIVASTNPKSIEQLVQDRRDLTTSPLNAAQNQKLTDALHKKDQLLVHINTNQTGTSGNTSTETLQPYISTQLDLIKQDLIDGNAIPVTNIPLTNVTHTLEAGKAKRVVSRPLTNMPGNTSGSEPSQNPPGWAHVRSFDLAKDKNGTIRVQNWVRFHLLHNLSMHGPGVAWNLVPADGQDNSRYYSDIESTMVTKLEQNPNGIFSFDVTVNKYRDEDPNTNYMTDFPESLTINAEELNDEGNGTYSTRDTIFNAEPFAFNVKPKASRAPGTAPSVIISQAGRENIMNFTTLGDNGARVLAASDTTSSAALTRTMVEEASDGPNFIIRLGYLRSIRDSLGDFTRNGNVEARVFLFAENESSAVKSALTRKINEYQDVADNYDNTSLQSAYNTLRLRKSASEIKESVAARFNITTRTFTNYINGSVLANPLIIKRIVNYLGTL